jgi:hypothetical protein
MRRREYIAAASVGMAGCLGDRATRRDPDAVKAEAEAVPYDALVRNPDQYNGRALVFEDARVLRFLQNGEDRQQAIIHIPDPDGWGANTLVGTWAGTPRLQRRDRLTLWAIMQGLYTFERTQDIAPELDIVDVLVEM